MNQPVLMRDKKIDQVDGLFVPIDNATLLLPMSAVAEVTNTFRVQSAEVQPECVYGTVGWRDIVIPLVSLEVLMGAGKPELPKVFQAAVVNTLGLKDGFDFYAVLVQGYPRPVRISDQDELTEVTGQEVTGVLMEVELEGHRALIPDLEGLEKYLSDSLYSC